MPVLSVDELMVNVEKTLGDKHSAKLKEIELKERDLAKREQELVSHEQATAKLLADTQAKHRAACDAIAQHKTLKKQQEQADKHAQLLVEKEAELKQRETDLAEKTRQQELRLNDLGSKLKAATEKLAGDEAEFVARDKQLKEAEARHAEKVATLRNLLVMQT